MKKHYLFVIKLIISLVILPMILSLSPVKAVSFFDVHSKTDSNEQFTKWNLYRNYPNPFNPSTSIKFEVPGNTSGIVKLVVYNSAGEEVRSLINSELAPGVYEVQFSAGDLASGVYYYSLITEGYIKTEKMILVK